MKVSQILKAKGSNVITIAPTDSVGTLSLLLRDSRIGAAVVSKDGQTVDGVISERDIAYGLCVHKADLHAMQVSTLMTRTVFTCGADDDVATVASTMLSRNVRHLPVVAADGKLVGMVSIRDVLNWRVDELNQQTAMLRSIASHAAPVPQDR